MGAGNLVLTENCSRNVFFLQMKLKGNPLSLHDLPLSGSGIISEL